MRFSTYSIFFAFVFICDLGLCGEPGATEAGNICAGQNCSISTGEGNLDDIKQAASKLKPSSHPLHELAKKDGDVKVAGIVTSPSSTTCSSAVFTFPEEKRLAPGEALYLDVPAHLRDRSATAALLGHRQRPEDGDNEALLNEENQTGKRAWDNSPGLTSVQCHVRNADPKKAWRYYKSTWGGSGPMGAKFAEIGHSPEYETLEGLRAHGHVGVHSGDTSTEPLLLDALRVVNTGKDPVYLRTLALKVAPESDQTIESIFTPGTKFEDYKTAISASYGGGEKFSGSYPESLELNGKNSHPKLPKGWKIIGGELHIPAPPGFRVTGVEVAVGDMHNDGSANQDGGTGSSGWAKLSMSLKKASGGTETLMATENVGKNDTMIGYPTDCDYRAVAGDTIVIKASADIAHIMGVRIHVKK